MNPSFDFQIDTALIYIGDIIHVNNWSSFVDELYWTWNGSMSYDATPSISFDSPGRKTIKLNAFYEFCQSSAEATILVHENVESSIYEQEKANPIGTSSLKNHFDLAGRLIPNSLNTLVINY